MARMGSFTARRSSTDYSSTIESMYRQYLDAQWTAIQDAWKNGGTYDFGDGKGAVKVTDDLIHAYMIQRRDAVGDPKDPLYEQWNNNAQQIEFNIGESKVSLAYKQGRMSAGAVASWYKSQLANYAPDSEIYRTIAADAADWAKANAQGAAMTHLSNQITAAGAVIDKGYTEALAVAKLAYSKGLITDPNYYKDPQAAISLIADPGALETLVNTSTLGFSWDQYSQSQVAVYNAYNDAATAYRSAGGDYADNATAASKKAADIAATVTGPMSSFDARDKYNIARDAYDHAMEAANGYPDAAIAATKAYTDALTSIKGQITNTDDQALIQHDIDAANGKDTGPTMAEAYGYGDQNESTKLATATQTALADSAALATGQKYYGQDATGAWGVHDPTKQPGMSIGPDNSLAISDPAWTVTKTNVGGVPVETIYHGAEITQSVLVKDGKVLTPAEIIAGGGIDKLLASGATSMQTGNGTGSYYFTNQAGQFIAYGTLVNGTMVYSQANPFADGDTNVGVGNDGKMYATVYTGGSLTTGSSGTSVAAAPPVVLRIAPPNTAALQGQVATSSALNTDVTYQAGGLRSIHRNQDVTGAPATIAGAPPGTMVGTAAQQALNSMPSLPRATTVPVNSQLQGPGAPTTTVPLTQSQIDQYTAARWAGAGASAAGLAAKLTPPPEDSNAELKDIRLFKQAKNTPTLPTLPSLGKVPHGAVL